jgi:hypothetical protein
MWSNIEDFSTLVKWGAGQLRRCDPYLIWADVTTDESAQGEGSIAVLVELAPNESYAEFRARMNTDEAIHFIPNSLEQDTGTRFVTGSTNVARLPFLVEQVVNGSIERLTLQQSRTDLVRAMASHWSAKHDRLEPDGSGGPQVEGAFQQDGHTGTFVGVIDDGFPLHRVRALLDDPSRLFCFWDQGWSPRQGGSAGLQYSSARALHWQAAWGQYTRPSGSASFQGFLYGQELKSMPAVADGDVYMLSGYGYPAPRHTHGAAVLGLAAPWLARRQSAITWPDHISGLALVQLPTSTVDDTSGGSLAMCVLDGLRYILWQERMNRPVSGPRPVVANISYGVHAGPHDGSSMFERAVVEMLDHHDYLRVALPAGNAQRADCHARCTLAVSGQKSAAARVDLCVQPDNASDTHVELWLPKTAKVLLRIQAPGSDTPVEIRTGEAKIHCEAVGSTLKRVHFAAVYAEDVAQSLDKKMILLSIGSTRNDVAATQNGTALGLAQKRRRAVLGCPGLWRLTLVNEGDAEVTVDVWVERDDAAPDRSYGSRQAHFLGTCATSEGTLNGIATLQHARASVVGAMRDDGPLSDYSAAAQNAGENLPTVVVPADWSRSVAGLRTIGFAPGAMSRVNGTSAACAVYTRTCAFESLLVGPLQRAAALKNAPAEHRDYPVINDDLRGQQCRTKFPFNLES